jgi:Stability determinant
MATARETIDHVTLSRLVEAGAVRGANVIGQPGGWGIVIRYGRTARALAAKRGAVRNFRKFETLVAYLKKIGVARYQVDATQFDPVGLKVERHRADAAERMKHAHEAAAYDKWFRVQVQAALDDPRPSIPHEKVKAEFAKKRDVLRKRAAANA